MLQEIIKQERDRLGWEQAELGRQLGVGQQTVSGWERGASRPRPHHVARLAELFGREVQELLEAAGYVAARAEPVPVRPRLDVLPLRDLPADRFEQFSADLARLLFDDPTASRYGGQGHKQDGIDVVATDQEGRTVVIQCKRHERFGPAQVKAAVKAAAGIQADQYYLFLTRVASPAARQEIQNHANWALWDVDDLSRVIRFELTRDLAVRLVDAYFPGTREPFLGEPAPGPWLLTTERFPLSGRDQLYSHDWDLVGRQLELAEITSWVGDGSSQVGIVTGRGGLGKTRLLKAVAEQVEAVRRIPVRFLDSKLNVTAEHFELLRGTGPLFIIVDDAHDRTDCASILAGIRRVQAQATVLFALRPYGRMPLLSDLHQVGIHHSELRTWQLDDLARADAEHLALQVLGTNGDRLIARRLAALTTDCSLLTVVGAGLIRRGALEPNRLDVDDDLRQEVLLGFRDALVTAAGGDSGLRRAVLDAVAVLQPVRLRDPAFDTALASLTGVPFDRVLPHLHNLVDGGVLLRRDQSLRIVPDLLGDVVLVEAAIDRASGRSTGFIDRARQAATEAALQNVFINACRIDWQVSRKIKNNWSLVDSLWDGLRAEFAATDISRRAALLRLLVEVAYYQPEQVLALVRWAIDNPTDVVEDDTYSTLFDLPAPNYDAVLHELPRLLKVVGFHLDYLGQAADILWELAQTDLRPTNAHPDHPVRVLEDLASYEAGKSVKYGKVLVDAVGRWLATADDDHYSALDVLRPLLKTEVAGYESDGRSLAMTRLLVRPDAVDDLRERAIALALTAMTSTDPKRAVRAVGLVEDALRRPRGLFGQAASDQDQAPWIPRFVRTLEQLGTTIADAELNPLVHVALREALRHHLRDQQWPALQAAAQAVLDRLPDSELYELADALHDPWRIRAEPGNFAEAQRRTQERLSHIAQELTCDRTDDEVVDLLTQRLTAEQRAFGPSNGNPSLLVSALLELRLSIALAVCHSVGQQADSPLRELVPVCLGRLAQEGHSDAIDWARRLSASDLVLTRLVASSFNYSSYDQRQLLPGERELLEGFVTHTDEIVRRLTLQSLQQLGLADRSTAVSLVALTNFVDSAEVATEVCGLFGNTGFLTWSDLTEQQQATFLRQLQTCPSIDDYNIMAFLSSLSAKDPNTILRLLIARVEHGQPDGARDRHQPLPHNWHVPLQVRASAQFEQVLQDTFDWLVSHVDDWYAARLGAELFEVVAQDFDQEVLDLLQRAIDTQVPDRIRAVGAILAKAPRTLIWEQVGFVRHALNVATRVHKDCVQAISAGLYAAVVSGANFAAPDDQPFLVDVEQRDTASDIAEQLPLGSPEEEFYRNLARSAENHIATVRHRDDVHDGRRW